MSMLECTALSKNYGSVEALRSIDLTLESGRIVGLVGPNGSGKTTLIKLAQHLLTPTSGMITIDGMIPGPQTKAIVSYLPDRDFLPQWMNLDESGRHARRARRIRETAFGKDVQGHTGKGPAYLHYEPGGQGVSSG